MPSVRLSALPLPSSKAEASREAISKRQPRGNPDMEADTELFQFYEGFQEALKHVLPPTLGFRGLSIRNLEIVLECDSGDFMIDGASGGLSTLIDLAWQICMFNTEERDSFIVLVDEVENHLHPTMQRRVLSDLLEAFPSARFIVSTHSPLIVNSVRDCAVYVLRYTTENQVVSELLDFENRAATASQVLDEALGVSTTIPVWADPVALLKSPRMGALLKRLESEYHMVLVDTPPMVSLADGAVVAAPGGRLRDGGQ